MPLIIHKNRSPPPPPQQCDMYIKEYNLYPDIDEIQLTEYAKRNIYPSESTDVSSQHNLYSICIIMVCLNGDILSYDTLSTRRGSHR